jgi:hypothetical protein
MYFKCSLTIKENKMKNKLLLSSALVGTLVSGSAAVAQTTITGSLDLTYTNVTSRTVAGNVGGSYRGLGRESQVNIQNKGKLNNGMDYAAGFALEFDGNSNYSDTNTSATTENSSISNENVYIDFISGTTTLTFGVDHIQNSQNSLSPGAGGDVANSLDAQHGLYTNAIGSNPKESIGMGLMQTVPNFGRVSLWYAPTATDSGGRDSRPKANKDGRNSAYEIGFVGNLGVTGLTAKAFYNHEDKPEKATSSTSGAPGSGTPSRDFTGESFGLQYKFGAVTVGADYAKTEFADNTDVEMTGAGIAYNLSKDVAVSYNYAKAERTAKTVDEKIHNLAVGYSLGPVSTSIQYNKISDAVASTGPTAGADQKYVILKAGTAF